MVGYPEAGGYNVFGGLWQFLPAPVLMAREFIAPPGGAMLHITLGPDVPVQPTSWGRLKTLYR